MHGTIPTFSPQQSEAIDKVARWMESGQAHQQVFRLFGYAGTGKTTIIRHLTSGFDGNVIYGAFTGKAAQMMQRSGCSGAGTLHSILYERVESPNGTWTFELDTHSIAADADLVVVDEVSMVDDQLAADLLSFRKPILVLGDPGQLPPVRGEGFFTRVMPDVMLTEVHRQALDSPVLRLATDIREGRTPGYGPHGSSRVAPDNSVPLAEVLAADQLIVGLNSTRRDYNAGVRAALGRDSALPVVGDRIVCLRNDYEKGIFNGSVFDVAETPSKPDARGRIHLQIRSVDVEDAPLIDVRAREECFAGGLDGLSWDERRGTQEFDYAYALTCHKAQGSQWNHVIVDNESHVARGDARRWLYTAVSRAIDRVTIVL